MYEFFVKFLADYLLIIVVIIGAVVMLRVPRKQRYSTWAWAVLAGLTALFFAKIAALFYQGSRPFEELGVSPGAAYLPNPGFPSDHVLLAMAITCVVWATTKNVRLTAILLACCILISIGRVLALVHTPWDVMGGAACALAAAMCVYNRRFFTAKQP